MSPNEIILDTEERRWLEMKAKENQTTIAALIDKAVKRMRQEEDKAKHPYARGSLRANKGNLEEIRWVGVPAKNSGEGV